jgi:hypothetical protein
LSGLNIYLSVPAGALALVFTCLYKALVPNNTRTPFRGCAVCWAWAERYGGGGERRGWGWMERLDSCPVEFRQVYSAGAKLKAEYLSGYYYYSYIASACMPCLGQRGDGEEGEQGEP